MNNQLPRSQEEWEEIECFLLQKMPPAEEELFRERMAKDLDLKDATEQIRLLSIGIQESLLQEKLDAFHQEISTKPDAEQRRKGKTLSMKRWLVAASALLIIALSAYLFIWRKNKEATLYADYFQPDTGLLTAMGTSSNYQFDRAMVDYKSGNYEAAANAWEGLLKLNPANDTLNYFLGSAYLANKSTDKAIPYFEKVIASANSAFVKDAYWYMALAQLKKEDKKKAIFYLQKSDYPEKEALLKKLEE